MATVFYFTPFVFIVPFVGILLNTLMDIAILEEVTNTIHFIFT